MASEPLTTRQVIDKLTELVTERPDVADLPVHILDMDDDPSGPDQPWDGLVTQVDIDCYSQEQGLVVCLNAWHSYPEWTANVRADALADLDDGGEVSGRE